MSKRAVFTVLICAGYAYVAFWTAFFVNARVRRGQVLQTSPRRRRRHRYQISCLQHLSRILKEPAPFFFDGAPDRVGKVGRIPSYIDQFLATSNGLALVKAFTRIPNLKLRRSIVLLVAQRRERMPSLYEFV
jgi:hypothetical protein